MGIAIRTAAMHYHLSAAVLRTPSAKRAHLEAAKEAMRQGHRLTWAGLPAPSVLPPWYAIGGASRFEIETKESSR